MSALEIIGAAALYIVGMVVVLYVVVILILTRDGGLELMALAGWAAIITFFVGVGGGLFLLGGVLL